MDRRQLIAFLILSLLAGPVMASETTRPEDNETDQPDLSQPIESEGIIPQGSLTVSTRPMTPIEPLTLRDPYDQGLEELALAQSLLEKGRSEAASDVALQAYDDLRAASAPRRNKQKRKKLFADRHQAAIVYITSSLTYIDEFVKRAGEGPKAIEEGHARAADLRDVSINYPELNRKVTAALERYTVLPSTPTSTH